MTLSQRGVIAALVAGSMAGGALGATVIDAASGSAATNTSSTSTTRAAPAPPYPGPPRAGGRFVPNEDPAHEKGESAQREAEENEGKIPRVP